MVQKVYLKGYIEAELRLTSVGMDFIVQFWGGGADEDNGWNSVLLVIYRLI